MRITPRGIVVARIVFGMQIHRGKSVHIAVKKRCNVELVRGNGILLLF